jgi:hypothetical protein
MDDRNDRTSADIEREIEADRRRLGDRISAIQERMSPGQLLDEAISYAKGSGGGEYVSSLGRAVKANPLPLALMGVSMAWLMAKHDTTSSSSSASPSSAFTASGNAYSNAGRDEDYPLYPVEGPIRRLGPPQSEGGSRYSHFADSSGRKVKALTDEAGHRAGHFVDEAGKTYRGFVDSSGKQVEHIMDEAGSLLDAATGWTSRTWSDMKDTASRFGHAASDAASSFTGRASSGSASMQDQANRLNEAILTQFRDQPLVGGALAFAVGAAIGAALPHTEQEDEMLGETADQAKRALAEEASSAISQASSVATDVYGRAVSVAAEVHDAAKDRVTEEVEAYRGTSGSSTSNT